MIPLVLPPLYGLGILVTRPEGQAGSLVEQLTRLGALARNWPTVSIEKLDYDAQPSTPCDLLIFVSVNAVSHGLPLLKHYSQARLAAVGAATARALEQQGCTLDAVPVATSNSEALLNHPLLINPPGHVTIVRGRGGRNLLQETLSARGAQTAVAEVYQRQPIHADAAAVEQLHLALLQDEIQLVTATSVDVLQALEDMLPIAVRAQLHDVALLCGSPRIAHAARDIGWRGEIVTARNPEESELLDTLTRWHARQRS